MIILLIGLFYTYFAIVGSFLCADWVFRGMVLSQQRIKQLQNLYWRSAEHNSFTTANNSAERSHSVKCSHRLWHAPSKLKS